MSRPTDGDYGDIDIVATDPNDSLQASWYGTPIPVKEDLMRRGKIFPVYLGDGVYADYDGQQIWLRTDRGGVHQIALLPAALAALDDYRRRIKEIFPATPTNPEPSAADRSPLA